MSAPQDTGVRALRPEGWPPPRGYTDGVIADGRLVVLAGQIGWDPTTCEFTTDDFVEQTRQALRNVAALLAAAGATPAHLVRMTWFVTSRDTYAAARRLLGAVWREEMGTTYPPMSVVFVAALWEPRALLEIEATAVVPR